MSRVKILQNRNISIMLFATGAKARIDFAHDYDDYASTRRNSVFNFCPLQITGRLKNIREGVKAC